MKRIYSYHLWFALPLITILITQGCKKSTTTFAEESPKANLLASMQNKLTVLSYKKSNELMEGFSVVLRNALKNDIEMRRFLKAEALKKFDLDYDILYHIIKDKIVSDNQTFRERLLNYARNEEELINYENNLPLLTIFVPEIPNFSAEKWDVENEIPAVSTGILNSDQTVNYYLKDGTQQQKKADLIPGFPLLIIKNNERVVLLDQSAKQQAANGRQITTRDNSYIFTSNDFDGSLNSQQAVQVKKGGVTTNSTCNNCLIDEKLSTAFGLWETYGVNNIWQRDYVYYTISPNSPNGPLDTRYEETLTSIKFKTGREAYEKISDQPEDPSTVNNPNPSYPTPTATWTEGSFEFNVTVLINNTQGLGTAITKLFPVDPSSLFVLHYVHQGDGYYTLNILPIQCNLSQRIAAWDIKNNGIAWKVTFSEVDKSSTSTETYTNTSQFATNFGFDLSKIGLKFGTTSTETSTSTYTLTTQLGDDQLGSAAMYFYDPVIISFDIIPGTGESSYTFKDIGTGWALLTFQPKK